MVHINASFNRLFGLFENGYVPKNDPRNLRDSLDTLQLMTPYTAGYSGTLGLNQEWARQEYKQSSWGYTKCSYDLTSGIATGDGSDGVPALSLVVSDPNGG